jgi:TatD DNase family protein
MHCFSGDLELAKRVLDLGFYISIPGVVTFKNAVSLQEVARTIPLKSMLIETDGPFLSPHPLRGKRNEPVNVVYIADCIASLRDIPLDEVAAETTANARTLFQLPPDISGGQP